MKDPLSLDLFFIPAPERPAWQTRPLLVPGAPLRYRTWPDVSSPPTSHTCATTQVVCMVECLYLPGGRIVIGRGIGELAIACILFILVSLFISIL